MQVSEPRDGTAFCGGRGRILVISASVSWPRKVRPLRLGNYDQDVTLFAIFARARTRCPYSSLYGESIKLQLPSDSKGQA